MPQTFWMIDDPVIDQPSSSGINKEKQKGKNYRKGREIESDRGVSREGVSERLYQSGPIEFFLH